jgi:hypothetical protein
LKSEEQWALSLPKYYFKKTHNVIELKPVTVHQKAVTVTP